MNLRGGSQQNRHPKGFEGLTENSKERRLSATPCQCQIGLFGQIQQVNNVVNAQGHDKKLSIEPMKDGFQDTPRHGAGLVGDSKAVDTLSPRIHVARFHPFSNGHPIPENSP